MVRREFNDLTGGGVENRGIRIFRDIDSYKGGGIEVPNEHKWHAFVDNFKTLRFTIVKWSAMENIELFRHALSN